MPSFVEKFDALYLREGIHHQRGFQESRFFCVRGARSLRSLAVARLSSAIARARCRGATLREPHRPRTLSHCFTSARACGVPVGRARSLRSLACARYARDLAVWPYGFRPTARPRARRVSTSTPPHRMPQVTTAPPPSLRIFRSRLQAVLELHVLSSGGSPSRQMLLVTTTSPPHFPHGHC